MANKVLKTLSNNIGFKILAVIFAFTLWITVYNLEDPTKTKTLTVNVTVTNKEFIDNLGKYYEIQEGTSRVSFSVTAARSILDKLDESDFVAVANMEYLKIGEDGTTGTVPIEITCTANVNQNSIKLGANNRNMKVSLEDLMSKQFVVKANAIGTVAEGYALGSVEVTAPNVLKVSGPKSIVQEIAAVVATIDITGMSESWTTYRATPVLYDANGKEVDTTRLTLSNTTVNVEAEILNTKEVGISVKPTGTVASGYMITAISSEPTTILLKGGKTLLNAITAIEIPEGIISVEGANRDITTTIDVSEYIPEGAQLVNPEQATIEITISIGKIKEKTFSLKTSDIVVTGLPTHAAIEFELSSIAVTISGLETEVNLLTNTALNAGIDVTNLGPGTHKVKLVLDIDETKYSYESVEITITITGEEADSESDSEAESESGEGE